MEIMFWCIAGSFFAAFALGAAFCGCYSATSKKLNDIAEDYKEKSLALAKKLDNANMINRRCQTELADMRENNKKLKQMYFELTAADKLNELRGAKNGTNDI